MSIQQQAMKQQFKVLRTPGDFFEALPPNLYKKYKTKTQDEDLLRLTKPYNKSVFNLYYISCTWNLT